MLEVRTYNNKRGVFSKKTLPEGTLMIELKGILKKISNKYSIQINNENHLHPYDEHETTMKKLLWPYLNHSCRPNAIVNVNTLQLVSLKNIKEDEEITFDYETTEWNMKEPFNCNCGSSNCREKIKGKLFLKQNSNHPF